MSHFDSSPRRLGLMTLLMACAFMAGWIRSQTVNDQLAITHQDKRHADLFHSASSALWWTHFDRLNEASWLPNQAGVKWDCYPVEHHPDDFETSFDWRVRWLGFRVGTLQPGAMGTASMAIWTLPYWSIVVPLCLVSVWLILPRTQTKPSAALGGRLQ